jgi:hypothetical protein
MAGFIIVVTETLSVIFLEQSFQFLDHGPKYWSEHPQRSSEEFLYKFVLNSVGHAHRPNSVEVFIDLNQFFYTGNKCYHCPQNIIIVKIRTHKYIFLQTFIFFKVFYSLSALNSFLNDNSSGRSSRIFVCFSSIIRNHRMPMIVSIHFVAKV